MLLSNLIAIATFMLTTLIITSCTYYYKPTSGPGGGLLSRRRLSVEVPLGRQHQQERLPRALHQHQVPGHAAHQRVGANPDLNLEPTRHETKCFQRAGHALSADGGRRRGRAPQKPRHAHSCWNWAPNLPVAACRAENGGLLVCVSDLSPGHLGRLSL